ncbi:hypothetical protein SELMODRAFT_418159 [Selaginella moellendorffii]|uniref:F-box domain-containing protein n=1 Tax=Selaginella moellendorffii TaxID=88036 RepID=D8S4V3_SELML|nr:uncharacterized protein LOC9653661 [Selaginella moellendorffii]EFJ20494.1 hypothetical protein SELMODRAFT_418159 [Selaginella moellendorffii]|eukprot:XP_002978508.1 uncharacterized protein LOC9653661 [Selaginella moellendorffii]
MESPCVRRGNGWSDLPLDIFYKIFELSCNGSFKRSLVPFLALSGVCKSWRSNTSRRCFQRLNIFWPLPGLEAKLCSKHKRELLHCDCIQASISALISRLQEVHTLKLHSVHKALQASKLTDSAWINMASSLRELDIGAGPVNFQVLERISSCINLESLKIRCLAPESDEFTSEARGVVLSKLHTLAMGVSYTAAPRMQHKGLEKFLELCPKLEIIKLVVEGRHSAFILEVPASLRNFVLHVRADLTSKVVVVAPGIAKLEAMDTRKVVVDSAACLKRVVLWPNIMLQLGNNCSTQVELALRGLHWEWYRLREIPSGVKRICLGDDFGQTFSKSGKLEFYSLFSTMFPGGSVEELELTTGVLSRVWYDEERRLSVQPSTWTIKHVFLVVAEDDIKAIAKTASNLVYSCGVQCVSMISPRDNREVWRWQRTNVPDPTSFESLLLGESTRS